MFGGSNFICPFSKQLQLKHQYFGHLIWRADSLEKTLMLGKMEGRRRRGRQRMRWWMPSLTRWTWLWASSRSWWWTGRPGVLQSMMSTQSTSHSTEWLNSTIGAMCARTTLELKLQKWERHRFLPLKEITEACVWRNGGKTTNNILQ